MKVEIAKLAGRLARGEPAPGPYPFDPTNGVRPDGPPYPSGAATGIPEGQPGGSWRRLQQVRFSWRGGELGHDRPVDRAFVIVQRRDRRRRWRRVADDLGLEILWTVDESGRYEAIWEIPRHVRRGTFRIVVRAKRYTLASRSFGVFRSQSLQLERVPARPGRVAVRMSYPPTVRDRNLTYRPRFVRGGRVTFVVGGRVVRVRRRRSTVFSVRAPAGVQVKVPARAARDRSLNVAGRGLRLQG
jgi:hypothetical protein